MLLAILAACAGPVLIFAGKLGWPEVPRPAFRPWLSMIRVKIRIVLVIVLVMMVLRTNICS